MIKHLLALMVFAVSYKTDHYGGMLAVGLLYILWTRDKLNAPR